MKLLVTTVALAGTMSFPALAQDASMDPAMMTCADFTALDSGSQAEVAQALRASVDGMEGTETADAGTAATGGVGEASAEAEQEAATGDGGADSAEDAASEAASGDASTIVAGIDPAEPPTEETSDAATQTETADAGAEAEGDARLNQQAAVVSEGEAEDAMTLSGLISACADDPTMMVTSAIMSVQGNEGANQ